jgi:DivIVA domain-containing protein
VTTVFFTLLTLATLGVVVAVAAGRITGGMDDPASSLPARGLPEGPLRAGDVQAVRFSAGLRGYRMDEVDRVVDALARELRRRDAELASLRERLDATEAFPADAPPPEPAGWFGTGPIPVLDDPVHELPPRLDQYRQADQYPPADQYQSRVD